MGRAPKYDWDDKKDICYQLYVEQKKSPGEIVKYFAQHFGCAENELPGVRLFRRQFADRWHFPPRKARVKPADEPVVVERIKQLWEQNLGVKEIRAALQEEGWELGDNEFQRLRKKNGFRRRGDVGAYSIEVGAGGKRKRGPEEMEQWLPVDDDPVGGVMGELDGHDGTADALLGLQQPQHQPVFALTPEEEARRFEHMAKVQAESDQALLNRKRRRRIRGYGHLPPDDPGLAPRYSSETTLDECKAFLHLSNEMYSTVRSEYELICRDMGIERKKTVMENGLWQASKDRLVRENLHLSAMMHPLQPDLERKAVAIDVICADVTKRMRDSKKKLTVGEANNTLGLNPRSSKELRRKYYEILERDQYTTRLACGDEHWAELRQQWFDTSPLLQQVVTEGDPHRMKCVDILCRDATKRYNDDSLKKDPTRRQYQQALYGPGPGACRSNKKKETPNGLTPAPTAPKKPTKKRAAVAGDLNIDPALAPNPIPAYFRLSPDSNLIGNHPRIWLGKLASPTILALHAAAAGKAGAAQVSKAQGIIKNADGSEDSYQIDDDGELQVYLEAAGDKSTFVVVLEGGYA
ncbi:hypothetical protein LTR36_007280 [Oleoguttula mirabilis]|uniref:Clr5 domain-containing protein n=1 Tax=Oleoguttula mirabilis TaxID=1507867 RepID=A0AAV9JAU3_9PEZI|nr:hypothetical protein LTR36_007280 [Oleoguttula mirabilis]